MILLLVLFVIWLYKTRSDHYHHYNKYHSSCDARIDHYDDSENPIDEGAEHDLNTLVRFGEIREDLVHSEQPLNNLQPTVQSIDERYKSAKRSTPADKMTRGVFSCAEKRRLVEKLIQRPTKKRNSRPKLWRHEFSDRLRGDVVPTHENKWDINKNPLTAEDGAQGIFATLNGGVWAADDGGTPMKDDEHMMYTVSDTKPRSDKLM